MLGGVEMLDVECCRGGALELKSSLGTRTWSDASVLASRGHVVRWAVPNLKDLWNCVCYESSQFWWLSIFTLISQIYFW